jgi:hypothetical protein
MSNLIEAMARAIEKSLAWDVESDVRASGLTREEQRQVATAALAALRETHHLVPKDQEPVAYDQRSGTARNLS